MGNSPIKLHTTLILTENPHGCKSFCYFFRTRQGLSLIHIYEDGTVDYTKDFFEKPVNLTVSGQLEAEAMTMAFGKVYTLSLIHI